MEQKNGIETRSKVLHQCIQKHISENTFSRITKIIGHMPTTQGRNDKAAEILRLLETNSEAELLPLLEKMEC